MRITGTMQLDAASVGDNEIKPNAAIAASKQQHVYPGRTNFGLQPTDTPVTKEFLVHVASQAGSVDTFSCRLNNVGSASSMTFDLKKNGSSILSALVTLTNASTSNLDYFGTLSNTTVAAGDRFSIVLTVSSSTGAQGPFAQVMIIENTSP